MRQRRVMELSPRSAEGGVERVFRAGVRRVRLAEAFWRLAIFGKFWIIKDTLFGRFSISGNRISRFFHTKM